MRSQNRLVSGMPGGEPLLPLMPDGVCDPLLLEGVCDPLLLEGVCDPLLLEGVCDPLLLEGACEDPLLLSAACADRASTEQRPVTATNARNLSMGHLCR